jgi:tRNA(fMet)-specific endonuclease VapC
VKYLFDTNAVIALLKGAEPLLGRVKKNHPADFGTSSVVVHELYYGAYKSVRRDENLERIEGLRFEVLEFDKEDARAAGFLRASLAKAGTPIGPYDVLIAGQALARSLTLLTRNQREFQRIKGLRSENWEA